jgi:quinohemoprotein ethanol dehydrogenase
MKPLKWMVCGGMVCGALAAALATSTLIGAQPPNGKDLTIIRQHQFDDGQAARQIAEAKGAVLIQHTQTLSPAGASSRGKTRRSTDWPLNGLDLANTRYAGLDRINAENIGRLGVRWIQQIIAGGQADFGPRHETIPIVVNGVMYVTDMRASVFALNAVTGQRIWQFIVPAAGVSRLRRVTNRGVVYGDGKVYTAAGGRMWALDAQTGMPLESFGGGAGLPVVARAVQDRFPGIEDTASLGYDSTIAPQFYDGMVFLTTNHSENYVPGGLIIAVNGTTGDMVWKFNTVPQDERDDGWDIAGPTWVGGVRNGGGTWNTPAIDPKLGLIYFAVGNPTPDLDGSARKGMNLFTNSVVALDVNTGRLRWHYQQVHHDIWDYDSSAPVVLFDTDAAGRKVKALGQPQKNGFLYLLNRETGRPLHRIVETPMSTTTDVPGEEVSPTQPIPHTARGRTMEPFVNIFPVDAPPEFLAQNPTAPFMTPLSVNRFTTLAPSLSGGTLYGQSGYSTQTGLFYVPGIDRVNAMQAQSVGATLRPGDSSFRGSVRQSGRDERGTLTAYDPSTAELVWQAQLPGQAQAGVLVTSGNLVFIGTGAGFLHGFDATTGQELFRFNTGNRVHAAPMTYEVNGRQYLTVAAGDIILTFALAGE